MRVVPLAQGGFEHRRVDLGESRHPLLHALKRHLDWIDARLAQP